jgi:hypothetical protein
MDNNHQQPRAYKNARQSFSLDAHLMRRVRHHSVAHDRNLLNLFDEIVADWLDGLDESYDSSEGNQ